MTTDQPLRWWAVLALRIIAGVALATATILLLGVAAEAAALPAAAMTAPAALPGPL